MNRIIVLLLIILLVSVLVFLRYGRKLFMPVVQQVKGVETVASREQALLPPVATRLQPALSRAGFTDLPDKIVLVGLKRERILQVYGYQLDSLRFIKAYPFTAFSGKIGPKLKEGDKQIPEGVYDIAYLNPNSSYYLSIKVSYPNAFDRQIAAREGRTQLGGDIFIHGKDVTIGCIPLGDPGIEEVFLMAAKSFEKGIEVIIAPHDFRVDPTYPEVDFIEWESELYPIIEKALLSIPL